MKRGLLNPVGIVAGLLLVLANAALAAAPIEINAEDLRGIDRATVISASELVIRGLRLNDETRNVIVRRVNPFAPDAFLNVDGVVQGPLVSERLYFRGDAHANGHSQVSLSVGSDGSVRGVLADSRGHWRLLSRDGRIEARQVNDEPANVASDHSPFQCGLNNDIRRISQESRDRFDQANPRVSPAPQGNDDRYRVRLAYDTTARFVDLFGTDQQAIDYLGDLTNFISALYIAELNTEIVISSTTLRDANEPWNPDGDLLAQFENYWNNNPELVDQNRTIAHIVDVGPSQGVAYVGALCSDGFDYGVSQGLGTEFDPNDNPQQWSFTVVAHELGHNFGSDHTHCYEPVIDECYDGEVGFGCWGGAESLPGPLGQQSGTIMSYCHLLDGGLSNIAVTLGRGHGFGVQPERVPNTMRQHVLDRAQVNNPRCPQLVTGGPTTFTVTPSAGANGTIDPAIPVVVEQGNTAVFTVTPDNGFTATVVGTCGGNLVDNTFTTNPINQNCTVVAQFEAVGGGGLCQETDLAIPDDDPAGVTSILTAPAGGAIEKLEVQLEIEHTYVGDLIIELEHSDGTTVRLINEQDCSGDNIDVILDDDAAPSIQDDCQVGGPAYPGERYRPDEPLAGFNGKPSGGNWTLRLSDNFADDTGVLRRWCLIPTEADEEVFADRFQLEQ